MNNWNHKQIQPPQRKLLPSWGGMNFSPLSTPRSFHQCFPIKFSPTCCDDWMNLELWESLSTGKKHHVVDDKLGQHCIASKVFYDVFLEVHNSMLHAHVFIFTCHVIGTPVFVCPTFLPETPRTRQNFSDSRPRRGNHPSKGQACGPSLAGGGICTGRLSRDRWRTEGFVRKISVQTYNFEMWSGRFVILWTLCVCFLPVWFLRSKKKAGTKYRATFGQHKITDFSWILFLHWYLGHIGHFVHHKPRSGNNLLQIATAYSL